MSEAHNNNPEATSSTNIHQALQSNPGYGALTIAGDSYGSYNENQKQDKLSLLREWYRLIYRHKLLITSVVLLILPFVTIEAYRKKSLYEASSTIEIRREAGSLSKPGEGLYYDIQDNTKAEAFIIKSRPVIEKAVVSLDLEHQPEFLDSGSKRSIWAALAAIRGSGESQSYKYEKSVVKDRKSVEPGSAAGEKGFGDSTENIDAIARRKLLTPYIDALTNNLKVDSVRDTRLLRLSFTHTDPEIAAMVANGVARSFIEFNFLNKTQHFNKTSTWLEDSTRKLKAQVQQAEQQLANYSRENNIFSLEGKENLTADKLVGLHGQYRRAEIDLILKKSLYDEVKQGRGAQLPEAFADPKTAELRSKLDEMAVTASQLSVKFGSRNPKVAEIQQQMATIQGQINVNRENLEEKLKADYERAVREEDSLKTALNIAKAEAVQQNQASIQYNILQQDLATAKALYNDFLNKTSQANIQLAEQYNNVQLIEEAIPPGGPTGPNRKSTILMGLFLSLGIGIGLAWLVENLNTTVRDIEGIGKSTQIPLLAVIPSLSLDSTISTRTDKSKIKNGIRLFQRKLAQPSNAIAVEKTNAVSAAEAYRTLRTSIMLSSAGRPPKTILVTSGQPGEGKTTTVYNTAVTLSHLKVDVLIIDCDMRKPRIHTLARLEKGKGLSTYLSSGGSVLEYIKQTQVPHLSILPCGPVPPNPSELISSESMKDMLTLLSGHYDYILIDSPPLASVTDPLILSTLVDGVILVGRSGKSKTEVLRRASQNLLSVRAKVLGSVLNDHNFNREGYDFYYSHNYHTEPADQLQSNEARD
jgi:capsular exopolysaccharide synthesis family protein